MATILITGCSTGLGYATAEHLARNGHTVYATMRKPQASPELAQLAQREKLPITILPLDVDSDESVQVAVTEVLEKAGQIDVLINNAGIGQTGPVEEASLIDFQSIMQTNYVGTLRCIQAVLPSMRERRSGCIINISSVAGRLYSPYHAAYCASKAAVEALSECLAGEVGSFGIRVAVIEPGVIDTPIIDKIGELYPNTHYPNHARLLAYLTTSAGHHVPASVVAEVVQEIILGERSAFRHLTGADGPVLLGWQGSLSDEDWIASAAIDDETWIAGMGQMGMDVRSQLELFSNVKNG